MRKLLQVAVAGGFAIAFAFLFSSRSKDLMPMMMKREVAVAALVALAGGVAVAAAWSRRTRRRARRWSCAEAIVRDLHERCETPVERLWEIADAMAAEMRAGIESESGSSLRMLPFPLETLPTGDEEGTFCGLEIGRTKFRMSIVQVLGNKPTKTTMEVQFPASLIVGTLKELFEFIAGELVKFISEEEKVSDAGKIWEVGISISFPVIHKPESGKAVVEWSMGLSLQEIGEEDFLAEMQNAFKKLGYEVHLTLVNDAVGTLVGGRYYDVDTVSAVILGMGTNAAYMESVHYAHKWPSTLPSHGHMAINIEWGNFVSSLFPITEYDVCSDSVDSDSGHPIFSRLVSGVYIGDIARRILLKISEDTLLFGHYVPSKLRVPFVLRTSHMASMHQDTSPDLAVVGEKMEEVLGIRDSTLRMRETVIEICDVVTKRAARLAAAGIVGILKHLDMDGTDKKAIVVVEGGVYQHYLLFRNYLHDGVKLMLRGKFSDNVVIEQGFGMGPALLAASASRQARDS